MKHFLHPSSMPEAVKFLHYCTQMYLYSAFQDWPYKFISLVCLNGYTTTPLRGHFRPTSLIRTPDQFPFRMLTKIYDQALGKLYVMTFLSILCTCMIY